MCCFVTSLLIPPLPRAPPPPFPRRPFLLAHPFYQQPHWVHYWAKPVIFAGAVIGMLVMGYLGDLIGRKRAMVMTMAIQVFGALGCALFTFGSAQTIYVVFCVCRLLLGVGVGGMYPLSASHSAEGSSSQDGAASRVGSAFFWQTPGSMGPYAVALVVLLIVGSRQCSYFEHDDDCVDLTTTHNVTCEWDDKKGVCHFGEDAPKTVPSVEYRLLCGIGAIPAFIVMMAATKEQDSAEFTHSTAQRKSKGALAELREHPELWKTLAGTAGCWFLYDVAFYGINIFQQEILEDIFGQGETVFALTWQALVVNSFGLVGIVLALACLKPFGCRWLSIYGFLIIAVLFAAMAITYAVCDRDTDHDGIDTMGSGSDGSSEATKAKAPSWSASVLFVEFVLLNVALNFGPNVSTFVLPAMAFPVHVRSTFHGISAGAGKLGAVLGTYMFPPMHQAHGFGIPGVLWVQCVLSLLGVALSYWALPEDRPRSQLSQPLMHRK